MIYINKLIVFIQEKKDTIKKDKFPESTYYDIYVDEEFENKKQLNEFCKNLFNAFKIFKKENDHFEIYDEYNDTVIFKKD